MIGFMVLEKQFECKMLECQNSEVESASVDSSIKIAQNANRSNNEKLENVHKRHVLQTFKGATNTFIGEQWNSSSDRI